MLTKKCIKQLFDDTDINVPVTIFSMSSKNPLYKASWFNVLHEALESKIAHCEQTYTFQITSIKGQVYMVQTTAKLIVDRLRCMFTEPFSLRIDALEDSDSSWIIILKSDL